jgi:hypothetical protein
MGLVSAAKTRAPKVKPAQTTRKFRRSMAFIASRASLTGQPVYVKHVAG